MTQVVFRCINCPLFATSGECNHPDAPPFPSDVISLSTAKQTKPEWCPLNLGEFTLSLVGSKITNDETNSKTKSTPSYNGKDFDEDSSGAFRRHMRRHYARRG